MIKNFHITGDGNVVGDNNRVITQVNKALALDPNRSAAAEALALLRAEIASLDVSDRRRRRSDRAIADVEDELAESEPDPEVVTTALERVSDTLQEAGETYDLATGWGKRLSDGAKAIAKVLPALADWSPF